MAKQAREIIASHFSMDIAEMADYRYQPTKWVNPAVYSFGDSGYYCAPASGKVPKNYCDMDNWQEIGEQYGRKIFKAVSE